MAKKTGRVERKYMAHFVKTNTSSSSPQYYRIGKDLSEFDIELNPIVTRESNVLGEEFVYVDGYTPSGEVETFYAEYGDKLFTRLQAIIDAQATGSGFVSELIDVHMWDERGTYVADGTVYENTFGAIKRNCVIVPSSYGGDTKSYRIAFTLQIYGDLTSGMFGISDSGACLFMPDL